MALNSINTNISAYYAQQNIGKASSSASSSVARLSSGNRIVKASDDVASLAAGTSLRTAVTTLKIALINTAQGSSLLQVADGALSQITDILQRQKAIAIQAGAGSQSDTERSFLNQEFQQLASEIDRLTSTTNFNGVTLLDGSVFDKVTPTVKNDSAGKASLTVQLNTASLAAGKTLVFNGAVFTATVSLTPTGQNFYSGDLDGMVNSLVQVLGASTNTLVSGAEYTRSGNSVVITQSAGGGAIGRTYIFGQGTAAATATNVAGQQSNGTATNFFAQGGDEIGLGFGRTIASGVVGDSIFTGQNQTNGNQDLTFAPALTLNAVSAAFVNKSIVFNDGANLSFSFTTAVTNDALQIQIGSTVEETLDNAVQVLKAYALNNAAVGTSNISTVDRRYWFNTLEFTRDARQINVSRTAVGSVNNAAGATVTIASTVTGSGPTAATALAGNTFGVNNGGGVLTTGVNNKDFVGTIKGFSATYTNNANLVNLSVKVGDATYQAFNVTTNVAANTVVRFNSDTGGYFDVEFQANTGSVVSDQTGANSFAARVEAAFSGLSFYSKRDVTSYNGSGSILTNGVVTGTLTGTRVRIQSGNFTDLAINDIKVTAPASGTTNGIIEFTVNGETYRSGTIGAFIRANQRVVLTSLTNANNIIEFYGPQTTDETVNTANNTDFSTADRAKSFEDALKSAFGFGAGGAALAFQVGTTVTDTLSVTIGNASTSKIYGGQSIDVLTQAGAANASNVLDDALDRVTSIRADVGALQSRFGYATNNIESSLQNQDAARGVLLDTDIAAESTAYATAQVQLQAGIAVLAQANLLPQNLLKLIG